MKNNNETTTKITKTDLDNANWEPSIDGTCDAPCEEMLAKVCGHSIRVGYCWDEQEGGCYCYVDEEPVEEIDGLDAEEICKLVGAPTGLTYECWEEWVDYHHSADPDFYDGWEDMDEDERWERYEHDRVQF